MNKRKTGVSKSLISFRKCCMCACSLLFMMAELVGCGSGKSQNEDAKNIETKGDIDEQILSLRYKQNL